MRTDVTLETEFQKNIIAQMQAQGWQLGSGKDYHREHALYEADLLAFVQSTQEAQWNKFKGIFPNDTERHFLACLPVLSSSCLLAYGLYTNSGTSRKIFFL